MKCAACSRDAKEKYCKYHLQALEQLKSHYGRWVDAYGGISWQDYMQKLLKMEETGSWVREVIEQEMKKES
jgi:hypothetical protein